jgi:hypothetical protein
MSQPVKLQIPEPCHEIWANMKPMEQGRFCGSCSKTVIDFSSMTDRQLFEFFQNYSGGACGRFHNDQLNRNIVVEQPKRTGWFRYVLTLLMPAMFLTNRSVAQGMVMKKTNTVCTPAKIPAVQERPVVKTVDVEAKMLDTPQVVQLEEPLYGRLGGISIVSKPVAEPYFHQFKKFITGSLGKNSFTVFPNPATSGKMLRTSFKAKKGNYFIQLLDVNGLMVQEQMLEARSEKMDIQIPISKNILPGLYTVLLVDDKRKKLGSQKLIVQ